MALRERGHFSNTNSPAKHFLALHTTLHHVESFFARLTTDLSAALQDHQYDHGHKLSSEFKGRLTGGFSNGGASRSGLVLPFFQGKFDHDKGQKSAISGRRLHWRLSTGIFCFFSSIYVQFSKTSPLESGESSEKSSGENRVKSCHVCGCHGFFGPDFCPFWDFSGIFLKFASDPRPPHTRQTYEQTSGRNTTPNASKQGKFGSLGAIFLPCMWGSGSQKQSPIFPICSGTLRGFSRFVLFLFLGLLTAPTRNSPERVRDTIRTFPEKSGKPPGLETPRLSFSQRVPQKPL